MPHLGGRRGKWQSHPRLYTSVAAVRASKLREEAAGKRLAHAVKARSEGVDAYFRKSAREWSSEASGLCLQKGDGRRER